jgi:hypothetical protein
MRAIVAPMPTVAAARVHRVAARVAETCRAVVSTAFAGELDFAEQIIAECYAQSPCMNR